MSTTVGIINPKSGSGTVTESFRKLRALLEPDAHPRFRGIEWAFTERRGHATELAREALRKGADTVLSVGGDGTHNEVVRGFFDPNGEPLNPSACIGIIHMGTGGDLRKSLGIGSEPEHSVAVLRRGETAAVDIGLLEYRSIDGAREKMHFANIASMGISGVVSSFVNRTGLKWLGGKTVFALATFNAFLRYRNRTMIIRLDDGPEERHRVCCLAAANGRSFGGGMKVAPEALLNDGLFDVVCLGDFGIDDFVTKGSRLYNGTHLSLEQVWWRRARKVEVRCSGKVELDVDGEAPGVLPATISLREKAVRFFVGETACVVRE
jgi:YegS/Rv2252/BmrU family lipid kinase